MEREETRKGRETRGKGKEKDRGGKYREGEVDFLAPVKGETPLCFRGNSQ